MSQTQSLPQQGTPLDTVDVLLVFDATALLSRYPDASRGPDAPSHGDAECCYFLAPDAGELVALNNGLFHVSGVVGSDLRLRPVTLALRAEYAVLLTAIRLADERTLSRPQPVIDEKAEIFVPRGEDPTQPERHPSIDHFWCTRILAHGSVDAQIDAIITDRDANILGCFRWELNIDVEAR